MSNERETVPTVSRTRAQVKSCEVLVGNLEIKVDREKGSYVIKMDGVERKHIEAFVLRCDVKDHKILRLETREYLFPCVESPGKSEE